MEKEGLQPISEPIPVDIYNGLVELLWSVGEQDPNGTVSCKKQQRTFEVAFEIRVARSLCNGLSDLLSRRVLPDGRRILLSVEEASQVAALGLLPRREE